MEFFRELVGDSRCGDEMWQRIERVTSGLYPEKIMFHRFPKSSCSRPIFFKSTAQITTRTTIRNIYRSMYNLTKPFEAAKLKVSDIHTLQCVDGDCNCARPILISSIIAMKSAELGMVSQVRVTWLLLPEILSPQPPYSNLRAR